MSLHTSEKKDKLGPGTKEGIEFCSIKLIYGDIIFVPGTHNMVVRMISHIDTDGESTTGAVFSCRWRNTQPLSSFLPSFLPSFLFFSSHRFTKTKAEGGGEIKLKGGGAGRRRNTSRQKMGGSVNRKMQEQKNRRKSKALSTVKHNTKRTSKQFSTTLFLRFSTIFPFPSVKRKTVNKKNQKMNISMSKGHKKEKQEGKKGRKKKALPLRPAVHEFRLIRSRSPSLSLSLPFSSPPSPSLTLIQPPPSINHSPWMAARSTEGVTGVRTRGNFI